MSKSKIKLPSDGSVQASLKNFREGGDGDNAWIVYGYEGKKKLVLVASGEGGASSAKEHFNPGQCRYALIRKEWKIELANTVKFAFISWTPSDLKPMRKAMLSVHRGAILEIMGSTHVQLQAEDLSEVNDETINDKFGFSSGTKVHVTVTERKEEVKHKRGSITRGTSGYITSSPDTKTRSTGSPHSSPASSTRSVKKLKMKDGDAILDAINAVKADSSPINWMLAVYENIKTLKLLEQGEGGVDEMLSHLDTSQVFYGYFRVTEQYDKSVTVKFGYLKCMTQSVSPIKRAKVSTHRGFITSLFTPSHVEFDIGDPTEIDEKTIMQKFGKASGTHSNVTDKKESLLARKMRVNKKVEHHVAVGSDRKMKFSNEEKFMDAISEVRNDSADTDWMLASYVKKNTIGLIGSGNGGLSELQGSFEAKNVNFGLLRVVETVDSSETVKFVFIKWQPTGISPMLKAEISTKKGAIDQLFLPWHVDFFIESAEEISDELVKEKVSAAAGTKDNITSGHEVLPPGAYS